MHFLTSSQKDKAWDLFILAARWLLAIVFLQYGVSKLTGNQFGLSEPSLLERPITELSLFQVSWYLFGQEQLFKYFVGVMQILSALLLLINRTALLGVLLLLPMIVGILVIDISYVKMPGFYYRLPIYILLNLLILWHHRQQVFPAVRMLISNVRPRFSYPLWVYLLLPIVAFFLEFILAVPKVLFFQLMRLF